VGWRLISWNPSQSGEAWLVDGTINDGSEVNFACFGLHGATIDQIVYTPSYLIFDDLKVVTVGDYLSVDDVKVDAKGINISVTPDFIDILSDIPIKEIKLYSITGALIKTVTPGIAAYKMGTSGLPKGVYVVKAVTESLQKNIKVIVK
jgi:hypothetical protein